MRTGSGLSGVKAQEFWTWLNEEVERRQRRRAADNAVLEELGADGHRFRAERQEACETFQKIQERFVRRFDGGDEVATGAGPKPVLERGLDHEKTVAFDALLRERAAAKWHYEDPVGESWRAASRRFQELARIEGAPATPGPSIPPPQEDLELVEMWVGDEVFPVEDGLSEEELEERMRAAVLRIVT
jgi:hypothetical protein